jgi:site-specific recombinase XerD
MNNGTSKGLTTFEVISMFESVLLHRTLSNNTIKAYTHDLHQFLQVAPNLLAEIKQEDVKKYLLSTSHRPASLRRRRISISMLIRWLQEGELITNQRAEELLIKESLSQDTQKLPQGSEAYESEIKSITILLETIKVSSLRDSLLYALVYETGMTISDALSLQVQDLLLFGNFPGISLHSKGKVRFVPFEYAPISRRLAIEFIESISTGDMPLFHAHHMHNAKNVLPLDYTTAHRNWQKYTRKMGVKVKLQTLRKIRKQELLSQGHSLKFISNLFGVRSITEKLDTSTQIRSVNNTFRPIKADKDPSGISKRPINERAGYVYVSTPDTTTRNHSEQSWKPKDFNVSKVYNIFAKELEQLLQAHNAWIGQLNDHPSIRLHPQLVNRLKRSLEFAKPLVTLNPDDLQKVIRAYKMSDKEATRLKAAVLATAIERALMDRIPDGIALMASQTILELLYEAMTNEPMLMDVR